MVADPERPAKSRAIVKKWTANSMIGALGRLESSTTFVGLLVAVEI